MAAGRVEQVTAIERNYNGKLEGTVFRWPPCAGDRYTEVAVKQLDCKYIHYIDTVNDFTLFKSNNRSCR